MKRFISKLIAVTLLLTLMTNIPLAFAYGDGYNIRNSAGECMLNSLGTGNESPMTVSNRDYTAEQIFYIQYRGDGTVTLAPSNRGGRLVDIATNGIPQNGDRVHIFNPTELGTKHWVMEYLEDGTVIFRAFLNPDLVLTANGTGHRSKISVTTYTGDSLQKWVLEPVATEPAIVDEWVEPAVGDTTPPVTVIPNNQPCQHVRINEERMPISSQSHRIASEREHYGAVMYKLTCADCGAYVGFTAREEYNPHDMWGEYCRYCSYNTMSPKRTAMDAVHGGLDTVGMLVDAADGLNMVLYLLEGDLKNAALSGISLIPLGDIFTKGGKITKSLVLEGAQKYGDDVVEGVVKASRKLNDIPTRKLQHGFEHAGDFGISGKWNKANGQLFDSALKKHIADAPDAIKGTYRGNIEVIHYYDPATRLWMAVDASDNYLAAWKLSSDQEFYLLTTGNVE